MKRMILMLSLALVCQSVVAQQRATVSGTIIDSDNSVGIPAIVVEIVSKSDTTAKRHVAASNAGIFKVTNLAWGNYTLRASYIGYEDIEQDFLVNKEAVELGDVYTRIKARQLQDAVVTAVTMRTSQKGDTVIYNADAFKVAKDADAEALLAKMPGITIKDGEVEAQGEVVKKIYVDGKEFFGQDVSTAIKNLPADAVAKVEVYNKLSDQAEFSGVDDGDGFKAINIVTEIKTAQFGKLYAGYGFNDKYIGGANINFFSGDHRFSIIAMANNMNQQNFSLEDVLGAVGGSSGGGHGGRGGRGGNSGFMVPQMDGTSTLQSFGVNYVGQWGKKVQASGSYFFNNSKNTNQRETDRQYFDPEWFYESDSKTVTRNNEHRFNARLDYKINDNHILMMRPSVSFQNYKSENANNSLSQEMVGGAMDMINKIESETNSRNWGYNLSNFLIYRVKLGKPGRTLTTHIGGSYGINDRKSLNQKLQEYNPSSAKPDSLFKQKILNDNMNWSLSGMMMYTEPVSEHSLVTAQYRLSYRYSDIDRRSYLWDESLGDYDPTISNDYSSIYNSGYITHNVGPGYNYSKDRNTFVASIFYQRSTLSADQEYPLSSELDKSFNNITYFAMLNRTFNPSTTMRIFARSRTQNPSVTQLQDVVDISNARQVTAGNPNLKPTYSNSLYANFVKSNTAKGRTFMVSTQFNLDSKYIADSTVMMSSDGSVTLPNGTVVDMERGSQLVRPINMNGYWSIGGTTSYGFPVKWLRSNLNINARANYSISPSKINGEKNKLSRQYYSMGLVLGSNISHNIDFTIGYDGGYNVASNSIRSDYNNEYFNQAASLRFKWVAWAGFTLSGNASYIHNMGITDDYNDHYVMCNLYIGKKVFKNQRGEIILGVNDLLNQKTSFSRNVTNEYIENVRNNVLGRYFGVQFVYNLRNYGKPAVEQAASFRDEMRGGMGR